MPLEFYKSRTYIRDFTVFINNVNPETKSGNLAVDGHLPSFVITPRPKQNFLPKKHNKFVRDLKNFKYQAFIDDYNSNDWDKIIDSPRNKSTRTSQYTLNRQFEFHRVPTSIADEELSEKVCQFMSLTGVDVQPSNLDKCHRLKKESSVVVEFKVREQRDPVLFARKNLKNKKREMEGLGLKDVIMTESLCFGYKKLDFLCRKLKSNDKASDTSFFNGKLFLLLGTEKKQISHINDLFALFDEESILSLLTPQ